MGGDAGEFFQFKIRTVILSFSREFLCPMWKFKIYQKILIDLRIWIFS